MTVVFMNTLNFNYAIRFIIVQDMYADAGTN